MHTVKRHRKKNKALKFCGNACAKSAKFSFRCLKYLVVGFFKSTYKFTKALLHFVCALFVYLVIFFVVLTFSLDYIIKYAINNSASYIEANAKVENVRIHLITQTIIIEKISLKNPTGFAEKDAFFAEKLELKFNILGKQKIERIFVGSPKIILEGRSEKRVVVPSMHKSNLFAMLREFMFFLSVDLDELLMGDSKDFTEQISVIEDDVKLLSPVKEIRVNNLRVINGAVDVFEISSFSFHNQTFALKDFKSNICGIETELGDVLMDTQNNTFGFSRFAIKNPQGYPEGNAFSLNNFSLKYENIKDPETGKQSVYIDKITVDSPQVRLEDKQGAMLGSLGSENNFLEIVKKISVMYPTERNNLFDSEFEGVNEGDEFKIPEVKFDKITIKNARLLCHKKDGIMVDELNLSPLNIGFDGIRSYLGGIKTIIKRMEIEPESQLVVLKAFDIRNPDGFPDERALRFGDIKIATSVQVINRKGVNIAIIESIEISDYFARLDSYDGSLGGLITDKNNLFAILDLLAASKEQIPMLRQTVEQEFHENHGPKPMKFIVKKVTLNGGKILIGPKGEAIQIPLENLDYEMLGDAEDGVTMHDIITKIVGDITEQSMESAEKEIADELGIDILWPFVKMAEKFMHLFY